jgi:GATA-binding protein
MSEAAQYGERGGILQHQHHLSHPSPSDSFAQPTGGAQQNTSSSNANSITEHDFRFPRRPLDQQQQGQRQSALISQYDFGESGDDFGTEDKLDFSGVEGVARKELLRESFFPTWKDDAVGADFDSPDEMQKKDPLATQIWRLYSKTKKQLPNQERMENLTWRMMAMNLRKRKQEEASRYVHYSHSTFSLVSNDLHSALRQNNMSAPSGIAQLRKSSDQNNDSSDPMNLDEFVYSDLISTPAGMSPSPELKEKDAPKSSTNAVASAIPIKMRKESTASFVPQSVPVPRHNVPAHDEFGYVQRHVRKTSIDERRVSILISWFIVIFLLFGSPL